MKFDFNNGVGEFRYSVDVVMGLYSLKKYLQSVYEDETFSNVSDMADCMTAQFTEIELKWPVKVYTSHNANQFADDIRNSAWSIAAQRDYTEELRNKDEYEFVVYSDSRDELNECINSIVEHCERHEIHGFVSGVVFHIRPIEWGERDF